GALRASQMLFMTDVAGIYSRWPDLSSMITEISISELQSMEFADGMVPKVEAAVNAIVSGATTARIFDGTSLDAFIDALEGSGGTWVRA
ncbi:MAG: acetylglutamate kinase, partial [Actinomycetota bacterium]